MNLCFLTTYQQIIYFCSFSNCLFNFTSKRYTFLRMKYRSSFRGFKVFSRGLFDYFRSPKISDQCYSLIEAGEAKTQRTSLDMELLLFCNLSKTVRRLGSAVLFSYL